MKKPLPFTPEEAKELLDRDFISEDTYDQLLAANDAPKNQASDAGMTEQQVKEGIEKNFPDLPVAKSTNPTTNPNPSYPPFVPPNDGKNPPQTLTIPETEIAAPKYNPNPTPAPKTTPQYTARDAGNLHNYSALGLGADDASKIDPTKPFLPSNPSATNPYLPSNNPSTSTNVPSTTSESPTSSSISNAGVTRSSYTDPRWKYLADIEDQDRKRQEALEDVSIAERSKAEDLSGIMDKTRKGFELTHALDEKEREEDYKKIEERVRSTDQEIEDYSKQKINPNRFFESMNTGQKVLAAFSLILGAFGAAKNGINQGVKTLNDEIDRDIRAQEVDLENKGKALGAKRNLLRDMMDITQNKQAAKSAARVVMLQNMDLALRSKATEYDNDIIEGKYKEAHAQIEKEIVREKAGLYDTIRREGIAQANAQQAQILNLKKTISEKALELVKAGAKPEEAYRTALSMYAGTIVGNRPLEGVYTKEQRERDEASVKADNAVYESDKLFKEAEGLTTSLRTTQGWKNSVDNAITGDSANQFATIQGAQRNILKSVIPKGANSDKDLEKLIEPLIVQPDDTPKIMQNKQRLFNNLIRTMTSDQSIGVPQDKAIKNSGATKNDKSK